MPSPAYDRPSQEGFYETFSSRRAFLLASLAVLTAVVPAAVQAHFKLLEPASWLVESDRGDPQKAAPCGNDPKADA